MTEIASYGDKSAVVSMHKLSGRRALKFAALRAANRLLVRPYLAMLNVPVVAVTGTNGKSTVTRLVSGLLRASGRRTASCTTDGVEHDGVFVTDRDDAGAGGAWRAAHCPGVEALVLEVARGGLLKHGTAFHRCDVGVVTNVGEDHLGEYGVETVAQMAGVKCEVLRRVRRNGTAVINADDPLVLQMAAETLARPTYFTVDGRDQAFGRCWYVRDREIRHRGLSGDRFFMSVDEIPMLCGGLQGYNTANVLASLAAVEGLQERLGVDWNAVRSELRRAGGEPGDMRQRNMLFERNGVYLLFARFKNPGSARLDAPLVERLSRALGTKSVIGILSVPGARQRDYYTGISAAVAPLCERFYVRPPASMFVRGMDPERLVALLSAAIDPAQLSTPRDAPLAGIAAEAQPGTLIVLFYAWADRDGNPGELSGGWRKVPFDRVLASGGVAL